MEYLAIGLALGLVVFPLVVMIVKIFERFGSKVNPQFIYDRISKRINSEPDYYLEDISEHVPIHYCVKIDISGKRNVDYESYIVDWIDKADKQVVVQDILYVLASQIAQWMQSIGKDIRYWDALSNEQKEQLFTMLRKRVPELIKYLIASERIVFKFYRIYRGRRQEYGEIYMTKSEAIDEVRVTSLERIWKDRGLSDEEISALEKQIEKQFRK